MLGIKKIEHITLDVWCGEAKDFYCNKTFTLSDITEDNITFKKSVVDSTYHISIAIGDSIKENTVSKALEIISQYFCEIKNPKRISFLTDELREYNKVCELLSKQDIKLKKC